MHGYLLSPSHPVGRFKARFFNALGYVAERWQDFQADLRAQHLTQESELSATMPAGRVFTIRAILNGRNGESAMVRRVWFVPTASVLRFVTAYPGGNQ